VAGSASSATVAEVAARQLQRAMCRQRTEAGMATPAADTAVLPSRTATLVTKTLAATAMAEAQTTTNNQLKAAAAMATEKAMMTVATMTMKTWYA
jgi:hypothetical protein